MKKYLRQLARDYAETLKKYQADSQEAVLVEAYELGRQAIAKGLGVLEMVRVQHQALERFEWPAMKGVAKTDFLKFINAFFMESLSPFEVTHRGFRETNIRLHHAINTLERRNVDLGRINRELHAEIAQRRRTEKALRESERHLRDLFDEAHRMEESLRGLSNQILHAQEEERKRVSRELHDDVGQSLVGVSVTLAALRMETAAKNGGIEKKLEEAQRLLEEAMMTVHDFARELRPATLDQLGLLPALRSYLEDFAKRTGLRVELNGHPDAEALDGDRRLVLYRIAQESLTNVAKHARATGVKVTIAKVHTGITLEIADNGKSFQQKKGTAPKPTQRLGLLGMQERVRLVNGTFDVRAFPGKGTTVIATVPFGISDIRSEHGLKKNGHPRRRALARPSMR